MGLQNSQSNGVYLTISNGKLVRQFKSPTDKSVTRTNKVGKEVYEEFYDSLTGKVTAVATKDTEYGKFWVITVNDGSENFYLQCNYSSGYATSFLKALPNVKLGEDVTLTPKQIIDGDKKSSVLFMNHNGPVKHFWTKDNPKELPQMKKVKIKGVESWDDSDRLEYLENYIKGLFGSPVEKPIEEEETPF